MAAPRTRRIGFLGYHQVTGLDLVGPMDVFATANELAGADRQEESKGPYELVLLGLGPEAFTAESGATFVPQAALSECTRLDTLLIAGGRGLREPARLRQAATWLRENHRPIRRIGSVCTGIYALAEAGLLDGRAATTHWRHADTVAARYPAIRIHSDAIFLRQGRFYTSAGITAGIDLSLALVEADHGQELALAVARELVVYLKRAGGQRQYSGRLTLHGDSAARLGALGVWMLDHLDQDLSVERLAARCQISPRQLSRRCRAALGMPPAAYVEKLRVEEAGHRLLADAASMEAIATAVGFGSADVFRRAFLRHFGIAPAAFRERFGTNGSVAG